MTLSPFLFICYPISDIEFVTARGVYLFDKDGKRYVDFESGIWCTSLGNNHPGIVERMLEQTREVIHLGPRFKMNAAAGTAERLLKHTPFPDGKVVFLSSGSEAVELGVRLAMEYTGRKKLLSFSGSYLGAYGMAALPAGNDRLLQMGLSKCSACESKECSSACESITDSDFNEIAAFVIEPVLASGGIIPVPEAVAKKLAYKVRGSGGLIVSDEVTSGLGRTGEWLGINLLGVEPDIIAFGKTLGNGYPVSAVVVKREIANVLEKKGFYYVQSHQNDPLGCAVADEVIKIIEDENLIEKAKHTGIVFKKLLDELCEKHHFIKEVRAVGLMLGMEFIPGYEKVLGRLWERMLAEGYVIGWKKDSRILRFLPPLTIEINDICSMLEALEKIISEK